MPAIGDTQPSHHPPSNQSAAADESSKSSPMTTPTTTSVHPSPPPTTTTTSVHHGAVSPPSTLSSSSMMMPSTCYPITLKFVDVSYRVKLPSSSSSNSTTNLRQIISSCGCSNIINPSPPNQQQEQVAEKTILHGITGVASPGEVLAVLGPSGSGKSTLLNALAGRSLTGSGLSGSILANERKLTKSVLRRTGFVAQDDCLYPHLTVRETLVFCALLRLPAGGLSRKEKVTVAESVLAEMGLGKCANTVIGNSFVRGVSGGERKRVSIAHEMLLNPSLLILDEPTSGLDSTAAFGLASKLVAMAKKGGKTVVASMHQPSSRVYQTFDRVLLLSEGRPLYFGKGSEAMRYFESVGFSPSFPMNPADFLLDLANGIFNPDGSPTERTNHQPNTVRQSLITSYTTHISPSAKSLTTSNSNPPTTRHHSIPIHSSKKPHHRQHNHISTWLNHFTVLFQRSLKERRHESFNSLRVLQVLAASLLAGTMWWRSDPNDIQDRLGLLFFISIFWGVFPSFNAAFAFPQDRLIFLKERASGMYSLSPYFMARIVGDLPMELILPSVFLSLTYLMTGLRAGLASFILSLLVVLGYVLVAQGLGLAVGAIIMDAKRASTVVTVTMLAFVLTGGFYVHNVPACFGWLKYVSVTYYCYRLLIGVQYGDGQELWSLLGCGGGVHHHHSSSSSSLAGRCKFIEEDIKGQISPLASVGVMLIMFVGYRLIAYLALKRIRV